MKRRYIDLDKAISLFHMTFFYSEKPISILECVPLEDVAPVVHAHWNNRRYHATCSNCGKYRGDWRTDSFKYCPYCGAKMDEEVNK